MSGGGPAVDAAGNIYLLTANGVFETTLDTQGFPNGGDYGNSFLKLTLAGGTLAVSDYFTMYNELSESAGDVDLGSGGILLLPDQTDAGGTVRHLAIGAGKDGNLYVVNRDSMGRFNAGTNNIWQQLSGVLGGGIWSSPAYFNATVYYGPVNGPLSAFALHAALLDAAPTATSPRQLRLSGHLAGGVRQRHEQRHRLGARELRSGGTARLRCRQSRPRALQQLAGRERPRPVRSGQQVHHARGRGRQGVRRHAKRRGGVRAAELIGRRAGRAVR